MRYALQSDKFEFNFTLILKKIIMRFLIFATSNVTFYIKPRNRFCIWLQSNIKLFIFLNNYDKCSKKTEQN